MKTRTFPALCSAVLGLGMIGSWTAILASGQMPELEATPYTALLHVAAELSTGALLIAGGYGLLTGRSWATRVHLVSLGMLLYAVVQASGYYLQAGSAVMVGLFAAAGLLALAFIRAALIDGRGRA